MKVLRLILGFYLFSTVVSDNIVTNIPNYNTEILYTESPAQETQGCKSSKTLINILNDLLGVLKEKNISDQDLKVAKINNALDLIKEYLEETPNGLENQDLYSKFKNLKERLQRDEMKPNKQYLRSFLEDNSKENVKTKIVFKYELPRINNPNCKEAFMKLIQSAHNAYLQLAKNPMCEDNSGNFYNNINLPKENSINNNVQKPNIDNDNKNNDPATFYITPNGNAPSNEFVRYVANQAFNQNPNSMLSILQNYRPGDNGNWPNNNQQLAYLTSQMPYSVLYSPTTIPVNQFSTTPKTNDIPIYDQDPSISVLHKYNPIGKDFSSNLEHAKSSAEEYVPKTGYYDNALNNEYISAVADRNSAPDTSLNIAPLISHVSNYPNVSGINLKQGQSELSVDTVQEMLKKLAPFQEVFKIKESKLVLQNTSNESVIPLPQSHNNKVVSYNKNPNEEYINIQPGSFIPNPYSQNNPNQHFVYQNGNIILNPFKKNHTEQQQQLQQSSGPPSDFENVNPVSSRGPSSLQNFDLLNPYEKKLFYEQSLAKLNTVVPNQQKNYTGLNLNNQSLLIQHKIVGNLNPEVQNSRQNIAISPYQNQNVLPNKPQNLANLNPINKNQLLNIQKLFGPLNLNGPSFEYSANQPNFGIANIEHSGLPYKYDWNITANVNPSQNKLLFQQSIYGTVYPNGSYADPNFENIQPQNSETQFSKKHEDFENLNNLNQLLYQKSTSGILKPQGLQPVQNFGKITYQQQNLGGIGLPNKQQYSGTMNFNEPYQILYQQSIAGIDKPKEPNLGQNIANAAYDPQNIRVISIDQSHLPNKQYYFKYENLNDPNQLLYQQSVAGSIKPKELNLGQNIGNAANDPQNIRVISIDQSHLPNNQYYSKNVILNDPNQALDQQRITGITKPKGLQAGQNIENIRYEQQNIGNMKSYNPNQPIDQQLVSGIVNPKTPNIGQTVDTPQYDIKKNGVVSNTSNKILPDNEYNRENVNHNYSPNQQYQSNAHEFINTKGENSDQVVENYVYDPKLAVIGLDGQGRFPNAKQQNFENPDFNGKHLYQYPKNEYEFLNPKLQYLIQEPVGVQNNGQNEIFIKPSYGYSPSGLHKYFVGQNPYMYNNLGREIHEPYNQNLYQQIKHQNYGYPNNGQNVLPQQQNAGIFNGKYPNQNQNFGYLNPRGIGPNYGHLSNYAVGDNLANLKRLASVANMYKLHPIHAAPSMIELTYLLKRPQPLIYQPYYFVKYKLPYSTFLADLKNILLKKPHLRTNPMKLYQELIPSSNISEVSPEIKDYSKDDIMQLIVRDGTSVNAKVVESNDTFLQEQLRAVQYLNANLGHNDVIHALDDMINFDQNKTLPNETSVTRNESAIISAATEPPKVEVESNNQVASTDPPKLNVVTLTNTLRKHYDAPINSNNDTITGTGNPANDSLVVIVQPNVNVSNVND